MDWSFFLFRLEPANDGAVDNCEKGHLASGKLCSTNPSQTDNVTISRLQCGTQFGKGVLLYNRASRISKLEVLSKNPSVLGLWGLML